MTLDFSALDGPYESVLDVGGSVGDFAAEAYEKWHSRVTSFEPLGIPAEMNRARALNRWEVCQVACGARHDRVEMLRNIGQPSASSILPLGGVRQSLGIVDTVAPQTVNMVTLDDYADCVIGRCLLKVDTEGYEMEVLKGASKVLPHIVTVVVEVQNDRNIFVGSPTVTELHNYLTYFGLLPVGVAGAFMHDGRVLQYDMVWAR